MGASHTLSAGFPPAEGSNLGMSLAAWGSRGHCPRPPHFTLQLSPPTLASAFAPFPGAGSLQRGSTGHEPPPFKSDAPPALHHLLPPQDARAASPPPEPPWWAMDGEAAHGASQPGDHRDTELEQFV